MQNNTSRNCPSNSQLKSFLVGDVPADKLDHIIDHVKTCARCESYLQIVDSSCDDYFVAELQRSQIPPNGLGKLEQPVTVPRPLIDAANRETSGNENSIPFDAGYRLAQKLKKWPMPFGTI